MLRAGPTARYMARRAQMLPFIHQPDATFGVADVAISLLFLSIIGLYRHGVH